MRHHGTNPIIDEDRGGADHDDETMDLGHELSTTTIGDVSMESFSLLDIERENQNKSCGLTQDIEGLTMASSVFPDPSSSTSTGLTQPMNELRVNTGDTLNTELLDSEASAAKSFLTQNMTDLSLQTQVLEGCQKANTAKSQKHPMSGLTPTFRGIRLKSVSSMRKIFEQNNTNEQTQGPDPFV